jgi:hypothetical protein
MLVTGVHQGALLQWNLQGHVPTIPVKGNVLPLTRILKHFAFFSLPDYYLVLNFLLFLLTLYQRYL